MTRVKPFILHLSVPQDCLNGLRMATSILDGFNRCNYEMETKEDQVCECGAISRSMENPFLEK
ncbi:hypothetical protein J6590_035571 [Homalodisca vitripennis]|nr:hypothetical protein J6590_035571 [Homalodisca vitripennis]